jgi:hypothetical protein
VQDWIQSRHNLQRKHAIGRAECELCHHHDETADHIMFGCPTATAFWTRLGVPPPAVPSATVLELWNMPLLPRRHRTVFLMDVSLVLMKNQVGEPFPTPIDSLLNLKDLQFPYLLCSWFDKEYFISLIYIYFFLCSSHCQKKILILF